MAVFDSLNRTYSPGVAPSVVQYYERSLLKNVQPELVHCKFGQAKKLPEHNGKRVQFRRFTPFSAVTTPLAEGVTPDGQTLQLTSFTAQVKPYGAHVELTDEMNMTMLDDMHAATCELLSNQAADSLDIISRNELNAGLNVQYAGGNTSRGALTASDKLTFAEIKKAVRTLKRNNAKPFDDGYYIGIVHPDCVYDLTNDDQWVDVAKYQDKSKIEKYELGRINQVRFFESTNAMIFKGDTYLYGTVTSIDADANFDATNKCLTADATFTEDQARELSGKLVNIQYTKTSVNYTVPMCIERVSVADSKIYFRWAPDTTTEWTTTNDLCIVPIGAGASNAEVYSTLIFGANSHGTIRLGEDGEKINIIIKEPGSSGASDPFNQRGTIAWKVKGFCTRILQDDFIVRLESGATA